MSERTKFILDESQIPAQWYNVIPDLPAPPPPPLHPGTGQPVGPGRPRAAVPDGAHRPGSHRRQRTSTSPARSSTSTSCGGRRPLFRARRLEKAAEHAGPDLLQVRGRLPRRVAQAEHRRPAGVLQLARGHQAAHHRDRRRASGAARWRSPAAQYGLDCEIWMVRASYDQKPHRRTLMETYGATVHPSPSRATNAGLKVLADDPGLHRQPRHRDQRGRRGGRRQPRRPVRARLGAQPRAHAPDRHRPGGARAVRAGRARRPGPT